jgi:hypothetical protein
MPDIETWVHQKYYGTALSSKAAHIRTLFKGTNALTPILITYIETKKYFVEVSKSREHAWNPSKFPATFGITFIYKDGQLTEGLNCGGFKSLEEARDYITKVITNEST